MSDTPSSPQAETDVVEIPGIAMGVETPEGETTLGLPIRPPANPEAVMSLMQTIDAALTEKQPGLEDAVLATLYVALGSSLAQAPQWPLAARIDAFERKVQAILADVREHLGS